MTGQGSSLRSQPCPLKRPTARAVAGGVQAVAGAVHHDYIPQRPILGYAHSVRLWACLSFCKSGPFGSLSLPFHPLEAFFTTQKRPFRLPVAVLSSAGSYPLTTQKQSFRLPVVALSSAGNYPLTTQKQSFLRMKGLLLKCGSTAVGGRRTIRCVTPAFRKLLAGLRKSIERSV